MSTKFAAGDRVKVMRIIGDACAETIDLFVGRYGTVTKELVPLDELIEMSLIDLKTIEVVATESCASVVDAVGCEQKNYVGVTLDGDPSYIVFHVDELERAE